MAVNSDATTVNPDTPDGTGVAISELGARLPLARHPSRPRDHGDPHRPGRERRGLTATARALGWRSLLVCLPFALIMAVDTLGWRYAFAYDRVPFLRLMAARIAGEAVNVMTAVAPVGGDAIKVWFLRPHVPYRESVASVIIAKTTITLSQALFLLVGVLVALALSVDARLVAAMLWLLLVELVGAGGFLLVQVTGLLGR